MPWKWVALESLTARVFSYKSDVWSYGVTLWEIFSLGDNPYGQDSDGEVLKKLVQGYRLPIPKFASKEMYEEHSEHSIQESDEYNEANCCFRYDYMLGTWNVHSEQRPTFNRLKENFDAILEDLSHQTSANDSGHDGNGTFIDVE